MIPNPIALHRARPGPTPEVGDPGPVLPYGRDTSEWWLDLLTRALSQRVERFRLLEAYYRGTNDTARLAGDAFREAGLAAMFPNLAINHSRLVVNAAANRLKLLGFRPQGALRADTEAARIWKANQMDSYSGVAHTEALVKGECPVLVEPDPNDARTPIITPQDPEQVIVWHSRSDRRIRLAAMKTWYDADARRRRYILYLPDRIERWEDRDAGLSNLLRDRVTPGAPAPWRHHESDAGDWSVPNPLGAVPVVVIPNGPRLSGSPEGEHEAVLPLFDLYNKTVMDMAATAHELAYPQRTASGVDAADEEPARDATGAVVAVAEPRARTGQNRWITTPNPEARFFQFAAADLGGYTTMLDMIRANIGSITATPYHYLLNMPSSVPPSGESITAAEAALVDKIEGHHSDKGAAWREAMRLCFLILEDRDRAAAVMGGDVIWQDPQRRTESQHIDALGKMRQMLGVPEEAVWERVPATPDEIERWNAMRAAAAPVGPPAPDEGGGSSDVPPHDAPVPLTTRPPAPVVPNG